MGNKKTPKVVVKGGLCTGCGTCVGICPNSSIKMVKSNYKGVYLPKINNEDCIQCGIRFETCPCFEACPGISVAFKTLNLSIFGKEPTDILLGNYIKCYTGHSIEYEIRYNSASGGLVTALLIFALEEGIIDGALVTRMKKDKTLEPDPFIARTKEEIIEASKSKYCPVPANIALKEILESEGEKFAVVGLPCHIHGIRKAETINKKLKERIVLHLGLFCHHTPTFLATEFILKRNKIRKEEVKEISYRGEGWPGAMRISLESGDVLLLHDYWSSGFGTYTFPTRCTVCCDMFCELSDIAFGDAWLPEFDKDEMGKSLIICRSKIGEDILQRAFTEGKIELSEISGNKVADTQRGALSFKKGSFRNRTFLFKLLGKKVPSYDTKFIERNFIYFLADFPFNLLFHLGVYIASKPFLWSILLPYTKLVERMNKLVAKIRSFAPHRLR